MSLKSLIERLKNRGSDTPDTLEENAGYQKKPISHAGCTPDTPDTPFFNNAGEIVQTGEESLTLTPEAQIVEYRLYRKLQPPPAAPEAPQAMPKDVQADDWRELDRAYQLHHFACKSCIAGGQGRGLRCGVGAALWIQYTTPP